MLTKEAHFLFILSGCCTGSCLWSLCQTFNIFIVCFQKYDAVWRHWNNTSKQFHPNTMGLFKRMAYFLWSLPNNYRTTTLTHKYFFISWLCEEKKIRVTLLFYSFRVTAFPGFLFNIGMLRLVKSANVPVTETSINSISGLSVFVSSRKDVGCRTRLDLFH